MPLTATAVRNVQASDKARKLTDGHGLYLLVTPAGGKLWRFDYRFDGKRKTLAIGRVPEVGLREARELHAAARSALARGIDPGEARKQARARRATIAEESFEAVAREWFAKNAPRWAKSHAGRIMRRLERDVFPWLGDRPIAEIGAPEILTVLRRVEARGALETAHRELQSCSQVFRYGVAIGKAQRDPTGDLRGALPPACSKHYPTITEPKGIGALLRAIEGYEGSLVTRCALRMAPLVFVRPGELRGAEWAEIDLDAAEWRIPGERMKMGARHLVPLSRQAVAILRELQPLTGAGKLVFPSERTRERPFSENTLNAALRRLGFTKDEMTAHGFRSMASTILNEQGWNRDAIERQLAHVERNTVRAAYNYAEHLEERRRMMQAWANYLDSLRDGAEVVPIHRRA